MPIHGPCNKLGSPITDVTLFGPRAAVTITDAIIDTGFSGFVRVPVSRIYQLRLPLVTFNEVASLDGKRRHILIADGAAKIGPYQAPGPIMIDQDSDFTLIGMKFLASAGLALFLKNGQWTMAEVRHLALA